MEKRKLSGNKLTIIQGLLAIVFGTIVVAYPGLSVSVLATLFGLVLFLVGVVLIVGSYKGKDLQKAGVLNFILGILSVVLAIVILSYPKQSVAAFLLLSVGVWAVITGGIVIWDYIQKSGRSKRQPVTLVFGIASLLFGLFMALRPVESTNWIAILVGIYAIIYGLHALFFSGHKKGVFG